jgi:hypothetical protein
LLPLPPNDYHDQRWTDLLSDLENKPEESNCQKKLKQNRDSFKDALGNIIASALG